MGSWSGNEEKVRVRAYHLWEAEGRPEGRENEFWVRALQLEQQEQESALGQVSGPPKAKRATTAKSSPAKSAKALPTPESKEAPKRRSRSIAAKGAAGEELRMGSAKLNQSVRH